MKTKNTKHRDDASSSLLAGKLHATVVPAILVQPFTVTIPNRQQERGCGALQHVAVALRWHGSGAAVVRLWRGGGTAISMREQLLREQQNGLLK